MKKILICIICLTLAFGVTACGKASDKDSNGDTKIISDAKNKQENSKSNTKKEVSKKEVAGDAGKGKSSKNKSKTNSNKIDVDLNNLNANVVYAQVFQMMTELISSSASVSECLVSSMSTLLRKETLVALLSTMRL